MTYSVNILSNQIIIIKANKKDILMNKATDYTLVVLIYNGLHRFECLIIVVCHYLTWIRRCGFFGVGVSLLEEVCHQRWALGLQMFKLSPVFKLFLLSAGDVEATLTYLCSTMSACMLPCFLS